MYTRTATHKSNTTRHTDTSTPAAEIAFELVGAARTYSFRPYAC